MSQQPNPDLDAIFRKYSNVLSNLVREPSPYTGLISAAPTAPSKPITFADIKGLFDTMEAVWEKPRATELRCARDAWEVIKAATKPVETSPTELFVPLAQFLAVRVYVVDDYPPRTWRIFDQHGDIMSEGRIPTAEDHLAQQLAELAQRLRRPKPEA